MSDYDVIIAGGGHNALICAALLVRNGLKVLVAERNDWVGGGVVTREVTLPGFKHDMFGSSHVWIHLNRISGSCSLNLKSTACNTSGRRTI